MCKRPSTYGIYGAINGLYVAIIPSVCLFCGGGFQ